MSDSSHSFRRVFPCSPRLVLTACALALALAGCAVGPDFTRPETAAPDDWNSWRSADDAARAGGHAGVALAMVAGVRRPRAEPVAAARRRRQSRPAHRGAALCAGAGPARRRRRAARAGDRRQRRHHAPAAERVRRRHPHDRRHRRRPRDAGQGPERASRYIRPASTRPGNWTCGAACAAPSRGGRRRSPPGRAAGPGPADAGQRPGAQLLRTAHRPAPDPAGARGHRRAGRPHAYPGGARPGRHGGPAGLGAAARRLADTRAQLPPLLAQAAASINQIALLLGERPGHCATSWRIRRRARASTWTGAKARARAPPPARRPCPTWRWACLPRSPGAGPTSAPPKPGCTAPPPTSAWPRPTCIPAFAWARMLAWSRT